jgi:hypothetical protein
MILFRKDIFLLRKFVDRLRTHAKDSRKTQCRPKSWLIVRQFDARPMPFGNRRHKAKAEAKTLFAGC